MTTPEAEDLKIYEITNVTTGEKSYQAATTAEDACKQAGWHIEDCFIVKPKPCMEAVPHHDSLVLVKVPCLTCPFQYAECKKPATEECPTRPKSPELAEWLNQAAEAHLCDYVGHSLAKKDYNLGQKWLNMEDAIAELSPKP